MRAFTSSEILLSVVFALCYGVLFSIFIKMLDILARVLKMLPQVAREIVIFDKIFPFPRSKELLKNEKTGGSFAFFSVLTFALGFLLLSYLTLDGQIRIYMLVLASASLYLSNFGFSSVLSLICVFTLDALIAVLCLVLRPLIFVFRQIATLFLLLFKTKKDI